MVFFVLLSLKGRQGFVESKIRQLLMRVEMVDGIILAHPFNDSFDKIHYCTTDDEAAQVATGEVISHLRAESTNLQKKIVSSDIDNGQDESIDDHGQPKSNIIVYTSTFYIGLIISLKDCNSSFWTSANAFLSSCNWRTTKIGHFLAVSGIL